MDRRVYGFRFLPSVLPAAAWLLLAVLVSAWRWSEGVSQIAAG